MNDKKCIICGDNADQEVSKSWFSGNACPTCIRFLDGLQGEIGGFRYSEDYIEQPVIDSIVRLIGLVKERACRDAF